MDDDRILSLVGKKKPFTISSQVGKTLKEVGVSLSRSKIKRCLHERRYRGFIIRCKPLVTLKNRKGQIRHCQETLMIPAQFCDKILWANETIINL